MTGFFLCDQPVCSLYAVGKITGTVIDVGYAKTGRCHYNQLPACKYAPVSEEEQSARGTFGCSVCVHAV